MILTVVRAENKALSYYSLSVIVTCVCLHSTGINVVSNLTCEENELTPDDYIKIIWTSAAELPGMAVGFHDTFSA